MKKKPKPRRERKRKRSEPRIKNISGRVLTTKRDTTMPTPLQVKVKRKTSQTRPLTVRVVANMIADRTAVMTATKTKRTSQNTRSFVKSTPHKRLPCYGASSTRRITLQTSSRMTETWFLHCRTNIPRTSSMRTINSRRIIGSHAATT